MPLGEEMKRIILYFQLITGFIFCLTSSSAWGNPTSPPPAPAPLIAAGSGVNLAITRLLAAACIKKYPQIAISVPGSIGTRGAIKAAADGAITFGLISRPLEKEEKALGLVAKPYARVAIVVAASANVKDEEITFQELIEIYKGTKTNWKDGSRIIVQAREKSDSGFLVLQDKIPGFQSAYMESYNAKRWSTYFTDQEANQALSKTPNAIGVSDLGMVKTENLNVKILKINGIYPNLENLLNRSYPFFRDLSFIYREKTLSKEGKSFMDFVRSEEGRKILRSNGYLPLP
jgi:phosphate transport system substrate-binding protein